MATEQDEEVQNWSLNADHVQACLKYIQQRGAKGVTAEELVKWDAQHGKQLFSWNETKAADAWRVHQARVFLNTFRGVFDRMRVRKFIHVPSNAATGRERDSYMDATIISSDVKLRAWAIADLTKRLARIASELKFWKLSESEREAVLAQLAASLE